MAKNKDGFEPGGNVSNDELYKHLAKQRIEAAKPKKSAKAKD